MIEVLNKLLTNILTALYQPFWFAVLLSALFMFFWLYSHERVSEQESCESDEEFRRDSGERGYKQAIRTWITCFKTTSSFRRIFCLTFYTTMILFRTLLNRNMWANPLSDIMGGWWIYDSNGELTTECIENGMLMVPFTVLLMWAAKSSGRTKLLKNMRVTTVLWQSVKITFIFSVCIEFLQLFLRLGTFHDQCT